jgi:hypothetical protein
MTGAPFAVTKRATVWIPDTGPDQDPQRAHLFVVLTDPSADGMVLMVPICTAATKYDNTCIVGSGDHPFLKHKSYVAYYRLNTFKASVLEEQAKRGIVQFRGMLDDKIFALVCAGVESSRQAAPIYKKYYAAQK